MLLDIIENVKPKGKAAWERVDNQYNASIKKINLSRVFSAKLVSREPKACKRRYYTLVTSRKSTGDPKCPPDVKRAKRIEQAILAEIHAQGGHSAEEDDDEVSSDSSGISAEDVYSDASNNDDNKTEVP